MILGYAKIENEADMQAQIDDLVRYKVDKLYEEKNDDEKQNQKTLNEILSELNAGDTFVIWRLDRLGRTLRQLFALIQGLETKGVFFVSLKEGIDTRTNTGKFFFNTLCALVQMESYTTSIRTKRSINSARTLGRINGRKPKNKGIVEEALKLYYESENTVEDIAKATGLSKSTIYKYVNLNNKKIADNLNKKT
jgi:DNA invertase Pin-like site-specific DNA recombinase